VVAEEAEAAVAALADTDDERVTPETALAAVEAEAPDPTDDGGGRDDP